MLFVTAILTVLLAAGIFLAAGELSGHRQDPEWKNVGKLRDRLAEPLPMVPAEGEAGRVEILAYCRWLRREYTSAWRLCRFLAPISGDPGYVGTLLVNKVRFQVMLLLAMLCASTGCSGTCAKLLKELRRLSAAIRSSALMFLTQADFEHSLSAA